MSCVSVNNVLRRFVPSPNLTTQLEGTHAYKTSSANFFEVIHPENVNIEGYKYLGTIFH